MQQLVESLAHLSSLRDREELDFALVKLIRDCCKGKLAHLQLFRTVGEPSDPRWQSCASLGQDQEHPERDRHWVDWENLPVLASQPGRHECLTTAEVVRFKTDAWVTCLPVGFKTRVDSVLELTSLKPLSPRCLAVVSGVLRIYQNVQGLLDYGEKDALTDLLNRKTFDGAFLKASLRRVEPLDDLFPDRRSNEGGSYWLAVMDIDHFKRINDGYGHLIGDEVLLLIARLMRASFRLNDQLYRFGGEEFVILLRCMKDADAKAALERFRILVEQHEFPQVGHITISIGYAALCANDTPSEGFSRADKAVYYGKGHGRNQVCSYEELVQMGELVEEASSNQEADFF